MSRVRFVSGDRFYYPNNIKEVLKNNLTCSIKTKIITKLIDNHDKRKDMAYLVECFFEEVI